MHNSLNWPLPLFAFECWLLFNLRRYQYKGCNILAELKCSIFLHRFGRKTLALAMAFVHTLLLLSISFSPNYWFYLSFVFFIGIPTVSLFMVGQIWGKFNQYRSNNHRAHVNRNLAEMEVNTPTLSNVDRSFNFKTLQKQA